MRATCSAAPRRRRSCRKSRGTARGSADDASAAAPSAYSGSMTSYAVRSAALASFVLIVAVAALLLAACSPVTLLNALAPRDTHREQRDIAYGPLPRQKLDLYVPVAAAPPQGWPVVVFFYGGSWNSGERADYRFVGEALAARGVLTLV